MKKNNVITITILSMFFCIVQAQKVQPLSIEQINYYLDSVSYDYLYTFDYENPINLPDSTKSKVIAILNGYIPPQKISEVTQISGAVMKKIDAECKLICKVDSSCFIRAKDSIINKMNNDALNMLNSKLFPENFLLAIGAWDVKEAIPILVKNIENPRYPKEETLLALAKLGNDSIKEIIMSKYNLEYVINNTEFKLNNPELIYHSNDRELVDDFFRAGMYLRSRQILLNMVDLLDIQGKVYSLDEYSPIELSILMWLPFKFMTKENLQNGTFEELDLLTEKFFYSISKYKNTPKIKEILSTKNKEVVKQEIKEWIIKNVEFD